MAVNNTVYSGFSALVGQDYATDPSYLPPTVASVTINRALRRGVNQTRPPFSQIMLQVEAGQEASILTDFMNGNFQGAYDYQAIKSNSFDGIAASVAGTIYFIRIVNNIGYLSVIATGNESGLMHTWFVQAEDWLYIQNGFQNAIAWDGTNPAIRLNPLLKKMPIGTIMAYAHGRVFVSDALNNIYASDIIFGNGFTDTSNTQNFTETTYWQEGASFTPPARFGQITGMRVMPSINVDVRGQGELVVFCEQGAFTLDTSVDRTLWKDSNIQKVSLIGRGNYSPYAVCGVNQNCMMRSSDGWSLYDNAQLEFNQDVAFRKLSREVNFWVEQDTPWLRQFASAMYFDNRIIATVSPYTVAPSTASEGQGLHRPNRAMIILDLDKETSTSPDAGLNYRWNGLWEGPQPTQLLTALINGQQRGFCFSYDADGINRLYELKTAGRDDFVENTSVKIKSYFITRRMSFSDSQQTTDFLTKTITGAKVYYSDVNEEVKIGVEYRADHYPCFNPLPTEQTVFCDNCNMPPDCTTAFSQPKFGFRNFSTPTPQCQQGSDVNITDGAEFQVKINLEGAVTIDRVRISANTGANIDLPQGHCSEKANCSPILCCSDNDLDFYRIIK